jgi:hypothetical protein
MKKIRLELDMLSVETFSTTGGAAEAGGTVKARENTEDYAGCESIDYCQGTLNCPATNATKECGSCNTDYDSCYAYSCGVTLCDTCLTCRGNTCDGAQSCSCFPCHY